MDGLRLPGDNNYADNTEKFDASQYAFFGKDVVEEVELGGLEEEGEEDVVFRGTDTMNNPFSFRGDEDEVREIGSVSSLDDLRIKFSKLNSDDHELGNMGIIGERGLFSEASWSGNVELKNWNDQPLLLEDAHLQKSYSSGPIFRTSSYPDHHLHRHHQHPPHHQQQQQQQQQNLLIHSNPVPVPSPPPPFTSYPPPGHHPSHASPIHSQMPFLSPKPSLSPPHLHNNWINPQHRFPHPLGQMMNQLSGSRPHHPLHHHTPQHPHLHFPSRRPPYPHPKMMIRSKYMSAEEIDSIMRIQHAATHSSDPYVEDYYHQACMAARSEHHFFSPGSIREFPPQSRANSEPHAFLQVDALGRVPFSSIRRPRPLLEVENEFQTENANENEKKVPSLEQEPLLAVRIAIEDGFLLLLDVDDIDRLLHFTHPSDGGDHFRRRRYALLQDLAMSLQLLDDQDQDFLRIISLPKGRKLISRYLRLLFPGSELSHVVSTTVFRHLNVLFSACASDSCTQKLVEAVSSSISAMDLSSLSSCLAAVVRSTEKPALRPIGSTQGDEASVVIKAVLERATELLSSPQAKMSYSIANRALWQASFDAFFELLTSYCVGKYDSIIVQGGGGAGKAIREAMPVDLLRASLPHTDEHQRKTLVEFAQRSTLPAGEVNGRGSGGRGQVGSAEFIAG